MTGWRYVWESRRQWLPRVSTEDATGSPARVADCGIPKTHSFIVRQVPEMIL